MKQLLSLNRLSIDLHVSREVLEYVAANKRRFYHPYIQLEKKRDGTVKERRIDNPNRSIRKIQKRINKILIRPECRDLPLMMTGSIPGRGIRDNAKPHAGAEAILSVDISNCFPSINSSRVYKVFRERYLCTPPVAKVLTKLTTFGDRLPQGAPTSPGLCNLVMEPLVLQLDVLCRKHGIQFTQYVDDLTFSGSYESLRKLKPTILRIVREHDFEVNIRKLKLVGKWNRLEVTGLIVNQVVGVGRSYIRRVERDILKGKDAESIKGRISHAQSISKARARALSRKLQSANKRT